MPKAVVIAILVLLAFIVVSFILGALIGRWLSREDCEAERLIRKERGDL